MITDTADSLAWRVVERFYRSWTNFQSMHDRYEQIVQDYVEKLGTPRDKIRLDPRDLFELLSTQDLEVLRDNYLTPLKEACHRLFRTEDSTDFLDRLVNDIFHELSILKEEHYNVLTYATDETALVLGPDRDLHEEQQAILDEVHDMFPSKVHRIAHLFETGSVALEALLHRWNSDVVLIRSLFLQREGFVEQAYPDGLDQFYKLMYGPEDYLIGYHVVGHSFFQSGFLEMAVTAFELGRAKSEATKNEDLLEEFKSLLTMVEEKREQRLAEENEDR